MLKKLFLKKVGLFSELSDDDAAKFLEIASDKTYRKNEVIFHADDPGSSLFILKSGSVKISICDSEGSEDILKIIYPYDFFGEMSLLDGQHRSATVTALEKSIALIIKRDNFIELVKKHPTIALNMLAALSRRIRKTDEKIWSLRFSDAYGKLARVLLDISGESGIRENNSIVINNELRRQDLADLAGLSRETATRILNEFQRSGSIKVDKRKIIILNEAILKRELSG
jgi:CRP-like cAMP-binding protein